MKNLMTIDWTTGMILAYDGTKTTVTPKKDFVEWLKTLPPGTNLVGEYAHFACPRKTLSKAQPFTDKELFKIYDICEQHDINLKLFPQMSTARALNYSKFRKPKNAKDPDRDAEAVWNLLNDYPQTSLMNPPESFSLSNIRLESYDFVARGNRDLNIGRGGETPYRDPEDENWKFLQKHIEDIMLELSPTALSAFGLDKCRYKKTGKVNFNKLKMTQIYSILVILQQPNGILNVRERTGELPGWGFVKRYVIKMTPFHLKGGVIRSNMYWHGMRNWVAEKAAEELGCTKKDFKGKYRGGYYNEDQDKFIKKFTKKEDDTYLKYRRQYCKAIKELYMAMKNIFEHTRKEDVVSKEVLV